MADMRNFSSKRDYYNQRLSSMKQERTSFETHWRELSEYIQPRRGRFEISDRNKGEKRNTKIINSKATMALRTASSGLMANLTSPARPWFRLETPDFEMMEFAPVKIWLSDVEKIMMAIFNESNLYNVLPVLYTELLLFGTAAMSHVDDFEDVSRFYPHTIGSYYIAQNNRQDIRTFYREFEWTCGQIVGEFGIENVSHGIKDCYDKGDYEKWWPIVHAVEENPEFNEDESSRNTKKKRYSSVYYEPGIDKNSRESILRMRGFDDFPVYVPRWDVTGEDIYGTSCPGMVALGDVKALQIEEKRKAQAIEKMVNPPLKGPGSLRNIPVSSLPGGITTYDSDTTREGLQPIYQVDPRLGELMADMQAIEQRIDRAFYVDLFLAISQMQGIQPRNEMEIMRREEEKLLMLGPVIERLFDDLLDPLIDRTFSQAVKAEILPPPPPELEGMDLKVNYISSLAQAQRAVGTGSIERVATFIGNLAGASGDPSVWDKYDKDQAVDEYASMVGVPPRTIVPDEAVAAQREERAAKQQQAEQMAMMGQGADAAAKIGQAVGGASKAGVDLNQIAQSGQGGNQ
jgi:hypothetical protein